MRCLYLYMKSFKFMETHTDKGVVLLFYNRGGCGIIFCERLFCTGKEKVMKRKIGLVMLFICSSLLMAGCSSEKKQYNKGVELAQEGKYSQAAEALEKAIAENKDRAEYYISYGMILNNMGEYQKAIEQFEMAYQDTENSIANKNNKQIYYGEAIAYFNLLQYEKSLKCCEEALKLEEPVSLDSDILCSQGAVLEVLGQQEEALQIYEKAIKKDEENWQAYLKKADLKLKLGEQEEVIELYQKVFQSAEKEKYEAGFKLVELYQEAGEEDTSQQILNEMIKKESKDSFILCQQGRAYQHKGDSEKAFEYFNKALEKKYNEANYYLGMYAMEQEEYANAKQYFVTYLEGDADEHFGMAYNQLAGCAMEQGDFVSAVTYLEEGKKLNDSESQLLIWKNLVVAYEKQGMFKKARKTAKEYLSLSPQDEEMQKELEFIKSRIKKKTAKKQEITQ